VESGLEYSKVII